jgi:hypothetical protein
MENTEQCLTCAVDIHNLGKALGIEGGHKVCTNEIFDEFLAKDGHKVFSNEFCDELGEEGETNVDEEYIPSNSAGSLKDLVTGCLFVNAAGFMWYLGDNLCSQVTWHVDDPDKPSEDLGDLGQNPKLKKKKNLKRKRGESGLPFAMPLQDKAFGSVVQSTPLPLAIQTYDTACMWLHGSAKYSGILAPFRSQVTYPNKPTTSDLDTMCDLVFQSFLY